MDIIELHKRQASALEHCALMKRLAFLSNNSQTSFHISYEYTLKLLLDLIG
jgi:hypothetical protein